MKLIQRSPITGELNTMELPLSVPEYLHAYHDWCNGALIQDAFPTLSPAQREFIMSGITEEEWDATFADDDEDAPDDLNNDELSRDEEM